MSFTLLGKLFNNPKTGFVGEEKLFHRARVYGPDINRKEVKQYLKENEIYQLFRTAQKVPQIPKIHGKIGHHQAD